MQTLKICWNSSAAQKHKFWTDNLVCNGLQFDIWDTQSLINAALNNKILKNVYSALSFCKKIERNNEQCLTYTKTDHIQSNVGDYLWPLGLKQGSIIYKLTWGIWGIFPLSTSVECLGIRFNHFVHQSLCANSWGIPRIFPL